MSRPTLIGGWYTPDYAHYADALLASLIEVGVPASAIDLISVDKTNTDWAHNTGRKASMILRAMDKHPNVRWLWLDVDCVARKNPLPYIDTIEAHLTVHVSGRIIGEGGYTHLSAGTMVINPGARPLIERWAELAKTFPHLNDEATLALAVPLEPGTMLCVLNPALADNDRNESPRSVIVHDTKGLQKRRGNWLGPIQRLRRLSRPLRIALRLREKVIRSEHGKLDG